MSYKNRLWMAASVAVVNGSDQGQKLKSGLKSLNHHGKKRFFQGTSGADVAELRPFSGVLNSDHGGFRRGDDQRRQTEESLRQVMYFNSWGQG